MEHIMEADYYGPYFEKLVQARDNLLLKIRKLLEELTEDPEHMPAEHIRSRIKSADSTRDKLRRLGCPTDAESALDTLSDVIGIRIVTHFVGDVYAILEKLKRDSGWEIVTVKDYIASPKPNGYRSLHVILKIPFGDAKRPFIRTEIQLRTIAMDCWASLEHQIKYKKEISDVTLIVAELKRCADEMASTDLSMQTIREMIRES